MHDGVMLAELIRGESAVRRADRRRRQHRERHSRLPERGGGSGRSTTRWRSRRSTPSGATRRGSGSSTGAGSACSRDAEPNDGHRALAELEREGWLDAVITQNVDRPARARPARATWSRCTARSRTCELPRVRRGRAADEQVVALAAASRVPRVRRASSSRTSSCSASCCRRRRSTARPSSRGEPRLCSSSARRSRCGRSPAYRDETLGAWRQARDRQPRADALRRARRARRARSAGEVLAAAAETLRPRVTPTTTGGAGPGTCSARALSRGALDRLLVEDARAGRTDLLLDLVRDARTLQQHVNPLGDVLVDLGGVRCRIVHLNHGNGIGGRPASTERVNLVATAL